MARAALGTKENNQRNSAITVAIADDHPIVLDGLEYLFWKEKEFTIVARCETAEEALQAVIEKDPAILLLDIRMPGRDGLWLLEQMGDLYRTQVIVLTAGIEDREIAKALKLGARGVVLKQRTSEDLINCIRKVRRGDRCIDEEVLRRVIHLITDPNGERREESDVTRREFEVIQLVARGLRNKEIGEKLSISEGTVKTHLRTIFRKIPVNSRIGLAIWARKNGLD